MSNYRINILTPIPFWHPGTQELIDGLRENGLNVVALDIWELRFFDEQNKIHELIPKCFKGFFAKVYRRLFRKKVIKTYIHKKDIVDIQWCGHYYAKYMDLIKKRDAKIIATLFGSDFYRSTDKEKNIQKKIFDVADKIVMGENMHVEFEQLFPDLSAKIMHNQFGSKRLNIIDELNTIEYKCILKEKFKIDSKKIVVTIGYNGKPEQQHIMFLNQILNLTEVQKSKLFLIFPLTYGLTDNPNYSSSLKQKIDELGIDYLLLEKRLSDIELAETKIISDITINCQTTDALASSIKESMLASDILLVGDWLPYQIYKDIGIYFETSNGTDFITKFIQIIENKEQYIQKCTTNGDKVMQFASWKSIIPQFVKIYTETNNT
jgi:glycosyltransferase involved in cell wall biosynthesis